MATIRDRYVLDVDTKGAVNSINRIKGAVGALAGVLAVRELAQFTSSIVAATTEFERYQTVLTTFLGSQQAANQELARLRELANTLPQDLQDITESFVIFTRYGLDASSEGLRAFSNIATASGKSLEQLAEALGDALTGEYERLKEFGIKVSQENGQIVARIGDDLVATATNAKDLVDQLQDLGNTRFGGAAEANAGTLRQALSNLRGAVFETSVAIGEGLKPALIEVSNSLSQLLKDNQELAKAFGTGLGEAIRTVAAGMEFLIQNADLVAGAIKTLLTIGALAWFRTLTKELTSAAIGARSKATQLQAVAKVLKDIGKLIPGVGLLRTIFLRLTGPIGLVITAVTGLFTAFGLVRNRTLELGGVTTTYGETASAVFWKLGQLLKSVGQSIKENLSGAFDFLGNLGIVQFFRDSFTQALQIVKDSINRKIGLFVGLFTLIRENLTLLPGMFFSALGAAFNVIKDFVFRAGGIFGELWDYITTLGEDKIENTFAGIGETVRAEIAGIQTGNAVDWEQILGTDYIGNATSAISEGLGGVVEEYRNAQAAARNYDDAILRQSRIAADNARIAQEQAAAIERVNQARAQELEAANKAVNAYTQSLNKTIEEYNFRTSLINLTEQERELAEQKYSLEQAMLTALAPLQERLTELRKLDTAEARAQIAVTEEAIARIRQSYTDTIPQIEAMVAARQRELQIQREQASIESARQAAAEAVADANERIRRAQEDAELAGLSGIRRELREIELQELRTARAAKERVRQQLESTVDASVINAELAKIDAATRASIQRQQEIVRAQYDQQRTFAYGWRTAFEEYAENATNAADTARTVFERTTQGMEDAIVGFAKTGKFEFKSFVASILEDLLRAQIRRAIANVFSMPSLGLSGSGGGGLFGGFFATGGMIPPGRFGIVGENGPEIVSGPANVTPAMNTSVTYNINAVDALSFKQLVAQDPGFIHAVAMKGGSAVPSGR